MPKTLFDLPPLRSTAIDDNELWMVSADKRGQIISAARIKPAPDQADESCPTCGDPSFMDPEIFNFVPQAGGTSGGGPQPTVHWAEGWVLCGKCGFTTWHSVCSD